MGKTLENGDTGCVAHLSAAAIALMLVTCLKIAAMSNQAS
jgi:hypothetical protein